MRTIQKIFWVTFLFAIFSCHETVVPEATKPSGSMAKVSKIAWSSFDFGQPSLASIGYAAKANGVDFESVFRDLIKNPKLDEIFVNAKASFHNSRINTSLDLPTDPDVNDSIYINMDKAYAFMNFQPNAQDYFKRIIEIVPEYDSDAETVNLAEIFGKIRDLQVEINANQSLSVDNKNSLLLMLSIMDDNIEDLILHLDEHLDSVSKMMAASNGRIQKNWFKKAWRVVRSVVVTTVVIAVVAGLATQNPYGALAGAIIGFVSSIADAAANDNCWYAMQCDGGWRQSCSTGECKPRASGGNNLPPIPSNPPGTSQEDFDNKFYNYEDQFVSCDGGRLEDGCSVADGNFTFAIFDQLGRANGVYTDVETRYASSASGTRWIIYKWQLANIFEEAVLRSLMLKKNTKQYFTMGGDDYSIPDAVVPTATRRVQFYVDGVVQTKDLWWPEGGFLEIKLSQYDEIPFSPTYNPYQLTKMMKYLTNNTDARYSESPLATMNEIGIPVISRAANNNAAILHLVTLSGVVPSAELKLEAIAESVILMHSTVSYSTLLGGTFISVNTPNSTINDTKSGRWTRPLGSPVAFDWSLRKWKI